MCGPRWRNSSAGDEKALFRLSGGTGLLPRLAVDRRLEPRSARRLRRNTLYVATTGEIGPGTIISLQRWLQAVSADPGAVPIAATDADAAGCRYAARLTDLATTATVRTERLTPPDSMNDWNDCLRATRG